MPSTVMIPVSGGMGLVYSGQAYLYSGGPFQIQGGVNLRYDVSGPGVVYVNTTNLSGLVVTNSGTAISGVVSFIDGVPMGRGDGYFIPRMKLVSGLESIRIGVPAAASGGLMYWDNF